MRERLNERERKCYRERLEMQRQTRSCLLIGFQPLFICLLSVNLDRISLKYTSWAADFHLLPLSLLFWCSSNRSKQTGFFTVTIGQSILTWWHPPLQYTVIAHIIMKWMQKTLIAKDCNFLFVYTDFILSEVHQNYVGTDAEKNPFFLSVVLSDQNNQRVPQYRAILWRKTVSQTDTGNRLCVRHVSSSDSYDRLTSSWNGSKLFTSIVWHPSVLKLTKHPQALCDGINMSWSFLWVTRTLLLNNPVL